MKTKKTIKIKHDLNLFKRKVKSRKKRKEINRSKNKYTKEIKQKNLIENKLRRNFKYYKHLRAPSNFSLLENTDDVLSFIEKINYCYEKKKDIFIEMTNVENIAHGTIVVLLSILVQFKSKGIRVNGNFPKFVNAKKILKESGFVEYLYKDIVSESEYYINKRICTHAKKTADSELSDNIIRSNSKILWGEEKRCIGVQRVFLELMQNTNNHASSIIGEKMWWSSIVPVKNEKGECEKICFSFIDYGVGIFSSLKSKSQGVFSGIMDKIRSTFGDKISDADLMKLLLKGEVHKTATGKYYRGKGLPGIYNAMKKNDISNLKILSNQAYADVGHDNYTLLKKDFSGTYVYWELNKYNNHLNKITYE